MLLLYNCGGYFRIYWSQFVSLIIYNIWLWSPFWCIIYTYIHSSVVFPCTRYRVMIHTCALFTCKVHIFTLHDLHFKRKLSSLCEGDLFSIGALTMTMGKICHSLSCIYHGKSCLFSTMFWPICIFSVLCCCRVTSIV